MAWDGCRGMRKGGWNSGIPQRHCPAGAGREAASMTGRRQAAPRCGAAPVMDRPRPFSRYFVPVAVNVPVLVPPTVPVAVSEFPVIWNVPLRMTVSGPESVVMPKVWAVTVPTPVVLS